MKRAAKASVLLLPLFLVLLTSCSGLQQVSEDIANSAPPATPPRILETKKLHKWDNDNNRYSAGLSFVLIVQRGFSNELEIMEDNSPIPRQNSSDPLDASRTVYRIEDVSHDTNLGTTKSEIVILPKVVAGGGPPHGTKHTYSLREHSINPKFKGTPEENSGPTSLTVVAIRDGAVIESFDPPPANSTNVTLSWRVRDCKQVKVFVADDIEFSNQVASGFSDVLEDSKNIQFSGTSVYTLRAYNARRQVIETSQPTSPPAPLCPQNPGGQPQSFTFCVTCPGDYETEWTQVACTEAEAEQIVQHYNANCTVKSGPCPP
jgi:hypothetical protein